MAPDHQTSALEAEAPAVAAPRPAPLRLVPVDAGEPPAAVPSPDVPTMGDLDELQRDLDDIDATLRALDS